MSTATNPMQMLSGQNRPPPPPSSSAPKGGGNDAVTQTLQSVGVSMGQAALIVGGVGMSFILPMVFGRAMPKMLKDIMWIGGVLMMTVGGVWVAMGQNWNPMDVMKLRLQSPVAMANYATNNYLSSMPTYLPQYHYNY